MTLSFQGTLKLGARGSRCVAVKRALARAGFGRLSSPATKTPVLGVFARGNIKLFQKKHGIDQSGVFGPRTYAALKPFFDAYSISLYMPKVNPNDLTRGRIVAAARYFAGIEPRVHYTESSLRMDIVRHKRRPPVEGDVYEDCSSFSTGCYWIAGAPDPNGRGYDGQGYTGTLCARGWAVSQAKAKPGDLVFYGHAAPWGHVAIYIGNGRVISHGSEGGPMELPIDYRSDRGQIRAYL